MKHPHPSDPPHYVHDAVKPQNIGTSPHALRFFMAAPAMVDTLMYHYRNNDILVRRETALRAPSSERTTIKEVKI